MYSDCLDFNRERQRSIEYQVVARCENEAFGQISYLVWKSLWPEGAGPIARKRLATSLHKQVFLYISPPTWLSLE